MKKQSHTKSFYIESSCHHTCNKGDVAMLKSLVKMLESHYPNSHYYIPADRFFKSSLGDVDVNVTKPLERDIFACPNNFPPNPLLRKVLKLWVNFCRGLEVIHIIFQAFKLRKTANSPQVLTATVENLWALRISDAIFVSGGGCLNDLWPTAVFVRAGLIPLLGRIFGKPVIMTSCGFGPLSKKWAKRWLRFCLKHVSFIGVREELTSSKILRSLNIPTNKIKVVGDDSLRIVAQYPPQTIKEQLGIAENRCVIGFNARLKKYNKDAAKYFDKMIQIIKSAANSLNAVVVFICSDFGQDDDNDLATAGRAKKLLGSGIDFRYFSDEIEPEQIKSLAAACDVVMAQSYHVLVFSLSSAVPAIGVYHSNYYKTKIDGLFDFVKSVDGTVDLRTKDVDQVAKKIIQICSDKKCRRNLLEDVAKWERLQKGWEKQIISVIES